jgi:hypothetical protein
MREKYIETTAGKAQTGDAAREITEAAVEWEPPVIKKLPLEKASLGRPSEVTFTDSQIAPYS